MIPGEKVVVFPYRQRVKRKLTDYETLTPTVKYDLMKVMSTCAPLNVSMYVQYIADKYQIGFMVRELIR